MTREIYAVFGCGGFAREVMPLVLKLLGSSQATQYSEAVFVTDLNMDEQQRSINGARVISLEELYQVEARKTVSIALADSQKRREIAGELKAAGIPLLTVHALSSLELANVQLGEGSILCPFVTLTSDISIGKCFHANIYSYVGHDCNIGDFVTFAPRVSCNGYVVMEDDVYVGTGAIIKEGSKGRPTVIGKGAKIAAGAFVTKNVAPGQTVIGSPAVPLTKESLRRGKNE